MNVKPGDLIEWVYCRDGEPVREEEILWSSVDGTFVPIGSSMTHLCVSCDEEKKTITWLNEKGVCCAHENDGSSAGKVGAGTRVISRVRR
jgi:hypothetical protein